MKIALASNPLNPANWSGSLADSLAVPFGWLDTVDDTDRFTRARERSNKMLARHVDVSREAEIGRIVNSACARYGVIGDDTPIPAEHLDAISREVSARFGAHTMKLPYEDKLSPERLRALLGMAKRDESSG
ncbi:MULTISPECIES: hypothetical protein [Bradyrhizobium]|uniref:hypothetical protein n=1 Tax=Bradyrhizobium elkanii TaxID=29448 RepID=UPI002715317D|nr:hypothetical protein [Bradyrhizobium elkanii]WLA47000.1 hypothetical protein QIH80_35655 [Bradyrhizobium elkanii]WLB82718.1 hypothetical protein QIH83_09115 [Bradyrhizobium elkanii]